MSLAPLPFLFSLPKRPVAPPAFGLTLLPGFPFLPVVVVEPVPVVVVEGVEVVLPVVVVTGPVGSSDSSLSAGLLHPGSARSTRPSLSLSTRSAHSGTTLGPSAGAVAVTSPAPTETELAVPAATTAKALPSAMMTRSFFLIFRLADPAREALGLPGSAGRSLPAATGQGGRY